MSYAVEPYAPCPCGSGKKFKFCCMKKAGEVRFPVGTVACYGPNDKITTKIVVGVSASEGSEAILEKFVGTDVAVDPKVAEKIKAIFTKHMVKRVVIADGNMGCPHEEGEDFPRGEDCPFCPWWAGKQGTARRMQVVGHAPLGRRINRYTPRVG